MSVGGVGGGRNRNFDLDHDLEVGHEAARTEDEPGAIARGGIGLGAKLPVGLGSLGPCVDGKTFEKTKDVNLIIGMAHLGASGTVTAADGHVGGQAKAGASVTLPFLGVPSPKHAMKDAVKNQHLTHPTQHTHTATASKTTGTYLDRREVGVDLASTPEGGDDAATVGSKAVDAASGGKVFLDKGTSVAADKTFWHKDQSVTKQGKGGEVTAGYGVDAGKLHAGAGASAKVTLHGAVAQASADVEATAVEATANVSYTTPGLTLSGVPLNGQVDATVHAVVGAEAHANGTLAIEPAEGRLFAGGEVGASAVAKIEGSATAAIQFTNADGNKESIGGITGSAYASAGAEAQAHARFGYDNGRISFDVGAGAALGLGAGYELKGDFDVHAAEHAGLQALEHAGDTVHHIEAKATALAAKVEGAAISEAKEIGHAAVREAKDLEHDVASGLKKLWKGL